MAATVLPRLRGRRRLWLIRSWSAHILHILNVRLELDGTPPASEPVLVVANHVSWLDIWAINAVQPVRFIAKAEMRAWPVLGWLAQQSGAIFIRRERRRDTSGVTAAGAAALRDGDLVCVFPEGTTTNGTWLYPFKSSLLQTAVEAGVAIHPLALRYSNENGMPNTDVAYYGNISLWQSLWSVLGQREIHVQLAFAPPIPVAGHHRRYLAHAAETAISSRVRLPVRAAPGTAFDPQAASH